MNRALRRWHGRMIVVIAALVVVVFIAAIALRPVPVPAAGTLVTEPAAKRSEPVEPEMAGREGAADGS